MVINQNIPGLTAYNDLAAAHENLAKAIEKFSTGLRVNSAADDAAGLAVSEKMRAQTNGIAQAIANTQDGISLIQTADGALSETQSILQRMRELSVQAANGTLTAQDRSYIQFEVGELRDEITRIANTTQFNTKKLLNGDAAALWSSDKTTTKAIIRGGLQDVDAFGQKTSFEGNYKIDIEAVPGEGAVLKTKLFTFLEQTDVYNYVGSGNYRDDEDNALTPSEAAMALDGYYSFNLVNSETGEELAVGLMAEAGQFSSMADVAKALNDGDLKDTEYETYFNTKAGALAVRALGHNFQVTGSDYSIAKLFGAASYISGATEVPAAPKSYVVDPKSYSYSYFYTPDDVDTTVQISASKPDSVVKDPTDGNIHLTEDGVYRISGSLDGTGIVVDDGVTATVVLDDFSGTNTGSEKCALEIGDNSDVSLVLSGESTLKSGSLRAGIEVPE
ncbi:MAG: hypothetical protein IJ702_09170, partial [Fretibacterium sp.]|nr:hypothetical protein [Fretibacterium sp.]